MSDHQMDGGFCKNGSNKYTESALWRPTLTKLLVSGSIKCSGVEAVVAVMEMPEKAWTSYGSYQTLYMKVSASSATALSLELFALGKTPTMLGEATMMTFRPEPKLVPRSSSASAWVMDKLGVGI